MVLVRFVRLRRSLALAITIALASGLLAGASVALAAKPDTETAVLSSVVLTGCNELEYGVVRGDRLQRLGTNRRSLPSCDPLVLRDKKVRYSASEGLILYLRDVTCDAIYYSDGSGDANHALIRTFSGFDFLDIADAGSGCWNKSQQNIPGAGAGNLRLTVFPDWTLAGG